MSEAEPPTIRGNADFSQVDDAFPLEEYREEMIRESAIHVFLVKRTAIPLPADDGAALAILSSAERQRAARFRRPEPRGTFVRTRLALRKLLGAYLGRDPADVRIRTGRFGKPYLAAPADVWLNFNVSHSDGYALVVLGRHRRVGVDLQRLACDLDHEALARQYFAAPEIEELERLPSPLRRQSFFAWWTRKEAYLKAIGGGLSIPLDRFGVSVRPDEPASLVRVDGIPGRASTWTVRDLAVAPSFAAAVAYEGENARLRCVELPLGW